MQKNQLRIYVHRQMDGITYELDPVAKREVEKHTSPHTVSSRVFISYDDKSALEMVHGAFSKQVIQILTGVSEEQAKEIGDFEFYDPRTDEPISREALAS